MQAVRIFSPARHANDDHVAWRLFTFALHTLDPDAVYQIYCTLASDGLVERKEDGKR